MHPFPTKAQLSPLIGQTLVNICCFSNQVGFHFDKATIVVETDFECRSGSDSAVVVIPKLPTDLFSLLDTDVSELELFDEGWTLSVRFSVDATLRFKSDPYYEAVHFSIEDQEFLA